MFGELGNIAGGVTYQELVELDDGWGTPAIHYVAERGQLNKITGGVTAKQLAQANTEATGKTTLHYAAESGSLDQIDGGATADDLITAKNKNGYTALHSAVHYGHLDQIKGGVTIQQLINAKDNDGQSAILINADWVDHVKEDLSFDQLAAVSDREGKTVIHHLASRGQLDKISGGVTVQQLASLRDSNGTTALEDALVDNPSVQIPGGLQPGLLTGDELNRMLDAILTKEYVGTECLQNVQELVRLGADKNIALTALRDEASSAQSSHEMADWQKDRVRFLRGFAEDLGFDVSTAIDPKITAQLI